MSDAKKTGSRDISELKQRLGLKKGGAPAASGASGSSARGNGQSGGVVAPPGLNLPPPPGIHQPAPAQPVMPNAADDPFGAMNAMAAVATVQRAPEIVIVNDGRPVEQVGGGGTLLKLLVPVVVGLGIGIAVGKIGSGASAYNDGLRGAKALADKGNANSVAAVKKLLADLDTALDDAKTRSGGNFKPDLALDKQLKEIAAKLEIKTDLVFRAKENSLDAEHAELAGQVLMFYAGVAEVKDMLDQHNKAAAGDDIALKKGKDAADAATIGDGALAGQLKYAVLVSAPTENEKADTGARLVELAGVYCEGANSPTPRCPEGTSFGAVAYRTDPGGTPIKGDLVTQSADSIPSKKLLLILPGGVRDSLIKGGEPTISEYYYARRLKAIYERIHGKSTGGPDAKAAGGLLDDGNKLETRLQTEAAKGSRFAFFM